MISSDFLINSEDFDFGSKWKERKMDVFRSNDNEFLFNLCFVLKVILFAEKMFRKWNKEKI